MDIGGLNAESPDDCDDDSPRGAPLFMFLDWHHYVLLSVIFRTIVSLELLHSTSGCRFPKRHVWSTNLTVYEAISPFNKNGLTAVRDVDESFLAHKPKLKCHGNGGVGTGRFGTSKADGTLVKAILADLSELTGLMHK